MDEQMRLGALEALLFVSGDPLSARDVARALDLTQQELDDLLAKYKKSCEESKRGIQLNRYGDTLQLSIRPEYAPLVINMLQPAQKQTLSQAVMETLSVVAYRQPITKADIEKVRGVKCDYSLQSLMHKGLICEQGRKDSVGKPILYGTTDKFLRHFGIESLGELPKQNEDPLENLGI